MLAKNISTIKSMIRSVINSKRIYLSSQLISKNYPYAFNGLSIPFVQNVQNQALITQLFGSETFQGFKQAYKYTLLSLAKKQKESLQNILQHNLTKNIQMKNVTLINQDSHIQVVCGNTFKAFGMRFARDQLSQMKAMNKQIDNLLYFNIGIMNRDNSSAMMTYISTGLPILLGFQILFKSQIKLIPQGQRSSNQNLKQIHSMQFQVQGKINLMKFMKIVAEQTVRKMSPKQALDSFKQMVGDNFQWKVGDIDRVHKGNIKVIG